MTELTLKWDHHKKIVYSAIQKMALLSRIQKLSFIVQLSLDWEWQVSQRLTTSSTSSSFAPYRGRKRLEIIN
jgi:hypothetical protein